MTTRHLVRCDRCGQTPTTRWRPTFADVRAWWPACPNYSPSDSLSTDAARFVPEVC